MKLHWRSARLFINAGMQFPECYSHSSLLDTDKSRLPSTGYQQNVTCKHCQRRIASYRQKAGLPPITW